METTTLLIIVSAALAVSEVLALIPAVKSNSIFQLIYNVLRTLAFGGKK